MPQGQPTVPIEALRIDAFSGGINTSSPANEIADNEAVEIVNMEYDDADNLTTRNGVVENSADVGLWDVDLWDAAAWDVSSIALYTKRITSILDFINESGFVGILYTTGTSLFSRTLTGTITNLTSTLVLPDDVRWYWKILNGIAIGVNGLTAGDNPVKVVGPAPGTATLLAGAPKGNFIEVWNDRVWIAKSDLPNQIQVSNLGDPLTWDTDAGANPSHGAIFDIDKNDGDEITGLYATKERLFIFKKRSIFVAFPERQDLPATDLRGLKIDTYAKNIGCLAGTTIKAVFDDVLFLSEGGIASLAAAQVVADFESAIISTKVKDIASIPKNIPHEDVFAFTVGDRNQYWLVLESQASPNGEHLAYVLDYRQIKRGVIRWVLFEGLVAGTAMEVYDHDVDQLIYLIGCHRQGTTDHFIGQYVPKAPIKTFTDAGLSYRKSITTKAYDFTLPDIRKFFLEWFISLSVESNDVAIAVSYFYDELSVASGMYSFSLQGSFGGTLWDVAMFDVDLYDNVVAGLNNKLIRRSFLLNSSGRKALSAQFNVFNNQVDQGYKIKNFGIKAGKLSEPRKTD